MVNYDTVLRSLPTADLIGPLNDIEAKHAPKVLYWVGDESLLRGTRRVSIVGTRSPSEDGKHRARQLARRLVGANIVVVSGLAKGIDIQAHRAAIDNGGRTIAVIGTPLHRAYPKEHTGYQEEIARDHLLVSEFSPNSKGHRGTFALRNRTMALISHATVIIEAGKSSGTESQAWEAIRLGRELFIAQSLLDSGLEWPCKLAQYGAQVLGKVEDLLEVLPHSLGSKDVSAF